MIENVESLGTELEFHVFSDRKRFASDADKQSGIYRVAFTAQSKWIWNFERVVPQITGAELSRALTGHFAWPKS